MEKLNLKEYISLEGASLANQMQITKQEWQKTLRGYQEDHNKTPGVLREIEAIQTIITDPEILKAYTINRVQIFIDECIRIINNSSLADNLDKKPASELISKLTSDYDCSGIDFSKCETQDDVRKALYEEAGIDYISPQEVKKAYNNINQLVDSNSNITEAMQNYEDLSHKAHCSIDNTGHLILGDRYLSPSDKVPYYQSGRGMASLIHTNQKGLSAMLKESVNTNQKDLSAMLNESVNTNQNTTGKIM